MIYIESQHFYLNRILLLLIGLWPYQQSKFVQFQTFLIFGLLISFIVFQLTTLLTVKCTLDIVIQIFTSVILFLIYLIEYNSFWINMQTVKYLLEKLQHICKELIDENEIAILRSYGRYAKLYTVGMTLTTIEGIVTFFILPFWDNISGLILDINASRSYHAMQIVTGYFIDQERYFYLILLHINVTWCIGMITVVATGSTLITYIVHFCGMLRIASYRMECAMSSSMLKSVSQKNELTIYKKIVLAVDIHRKAMQYSEFLTSNFEGMFFLLIIFSVLSLSLNLFQIVSFGGNPEEFFLQLLYGCIILVYIFVANYAGQEITDHNNHIFFTAYNVQWYVAPVHIQKLILFLLQRGNKPFHLNIGGLFTACLESFSMLTSASISYFTVIYSTQN